MWLSVSECGSSNSESLTFEGLQPGQHAVVPLFGDGR